MALKIGIAETEDEKLACYRLRYDVNVAEGRAGGFICPATRPVID